MSYIDKIKDRARLDKKTIVLPETTDKRTLIAAAKIMEEGIADIILIGNEEKIMDGAGWLEVDLDKATIINPATTDKLDRYVDILYETDQSLLYGKRQLMDFYRSRCMTLGENIVLVRGEEKRYGKAIDLDEDGGLVVCYSDGSTGTVSSGEVSVRGMYGYL